MYSKSKNAKGLLEHTITKYKENICCLCECVAILLDEKFVFSVERNRVKTVSAYYTLVTFDSMK